MGLKTLLLGSKLRIALSFVIALGLALAGGVAAGVLGVPSVVAVDNGFGAVTNATTTIETDLVVTNPNPVGAELGGATVNYTVAMNGIRMASGEKEGLRMGTGNTTLVFETRMQNERIPPWWASHVANGERTALRIDARVRSSLLGTSATVPYTQTIETDLLGQFNSSETRPVNANQPGIDDPVLYVNRTRAHWGDVTRSETPMALRFRVYNPKPAPYTITEIGYTITMNDVRVGAGASEREYVIPPDGTRTIRTRTVIDNPTLDEWWVSHLERGQLTDLRIDFYARIELPGGTTVEVPLDALTYEERIETDIFGEGGTPPDDGTGDRTGPTPTAAPTPTPTPGVGDTVGTPTPPPLPGDDTPTPGADNATATATPTATPTDDGGLLGY